MNFKEGEVLFFDKPLTWTSFAVVNKIRYHLCRRMGVKKLKVGHAGTLDPLTNELDRHILPCLRTHPHAHRCVARVPEGPVPACRLGLGDQLLNGF